MPITIKNKPITKPKDEAKADPKEEVQTTQESKVDEAPAEEQQSEPETVEQGSNDPADAEQPKKPGTVGAAKKQMEAKQGTATVSKSNKKTKVETQETEPVGPVVYSEKKLAMVEVEMSMTMNLGNYNSAKLGVRLAMPSDVDEIESTYEGAKLWVENKVNELVEALKDEE